MDALQITAPPTLPVSQPVLLESKLRPPRSTNDAMLAPRERLDLDLDSTSAPRVTLICAPAGFGKTTLVVQALERTATSEVAWLSIDERDNDPVRFQSYLLAALQDALVRTNAGSPGATRDDAAAIDRALNAISRAGHPVTLVIDDLHRVEHPTVFRLLNQLIEDLPSSMRLIIVTRTEPPMPLARLRAYGKLRDIRAAELSFTLAETEAFLALDDTIALNADLARQIHHQTEGWIFALQVLRSLLHDASAEQQQTTIRGLTSGRKQVASFLLEEVLHAQPPDRRAFLTRTSIAARLTGGLCDALTGGTGSEATLRALVRDGMPIWSLDDGRTAYRYHHLFAGFLAGQLEAQHGTDAIAGLHRTACAFLKADGLPEEAIEHAIAAADWPEVIGLLREIGYDPVGQQRVATFRRWLEALPFALRDADPLLSYWHGRSLYTMSEPKKALAPLKRAEVLWSDAGALDMVAAVKESQAWCAILDRDHAAAVQLAGDALRISFDIHRAPEPTAGAHYTHAVALSRVGRALEAFEQMSRVAFDSLVDVSTIERGHILYLLGRFDEAEANLRRGIAVDNPTKQLLRALIWLSKIELARNQLAQSRVHLDRASVLFATMEAPPSYPSLGVAEARLLWAEDRYDAALRTAESEVRRATSLNLPAAQRDAEALRATFWLNTGRIGDAENWTRLIAARYPDDVLTPAVLIARGRVMRHLGQLRPAADLYQQLMAEAVRDGRMVHAGRAAVQLGVSLDESGSQAAAEDALARALDWLAPGRHVRAFIDDGAAPRSLRILERMAARGRHLDEIGRVLIAVRVPNPAVEDLPPLRPREIEVLRLVAVGLSNREIADQLYIAIPTVKRHLSTVFDKLRSANRAQAVDTARARGLL